VTLGPSDYNTTFPFLHHAQKQIRVVLVARALAPVALGVGHSPITYQIIFLHIPQEIIKPSVIVGALFLINLISGAGQSVHGVHAHATLEAGPGLLPQQSLHLYFVYQVSGAAVNMGKPVNCLAR